jgi:polyhydroxybutyrate depolymerase
MSLAGSTYADPSDCTADAPVDVLQVHGTADDTILYDGDLPYPGAETVVSQWAERAGCDGQTSEGTADYDAFTSGAETTREPRTGCGGSEIALWRLDGAGHIPALTDAWRTDSLDWLLTD